VHHIRDWDIRLASPERIRGSQRCYTSHGSGVLIACSTLRTVHRCLLMNRCIRADFPHPAFV